MNRYHALKLIALISLTTLPLGTVACSKGSSSPTEPAFLEDDAVVTTTTATSASSASLVTGESKGRGGSDDPEGDDNGGKKGGKNGKGGKGDKGGKDDKAPRAGREFEGAVTSVGGSSLTLANGTRIVVNGQTRWVARGDLHTLSQVARSVDAGRPTRAEGRGTRQADGSIVAQTLKVEVDD